MLGGTATGTFSSRKIEALTYDSVPVRFLTADTQPDLHSICKFHLQIPARKQRAALLVLPPDPRTRRHSRESTYSQASWLTTARIWDDCGLLSRVSYYLGGESARLRPLVLNSSNWVLSCFTILGYL